MGISAQALKIVRVGRKRKQTVSVAKVHERLATDLLANAIVMPVTVDDPLEPGGKLLVMRSLRDDPLSRYHARKQIDEAQFQAGLAWQNDYEASEIGGVGAIDPTKEAVDGGKLPELVTDHQRRAMARLASDEKALGMEGGALIRDVLGRRMFFEQVAEARGFGGEKSLRYFARRFRECLETLAIVRGFAMRTRA